MHKVGGPHFAAAGQEFLRYFVDFRGLEPHDRVLDVVCGTGRMAKPLTDYLRGGSYDGIAIVAYDEDVVCALYGRCGLSISEPIRYGRWCGRGGALSRQDIVIAVKN